MVRLRPRVNVRTGGSEEGAFGRSSAACAQASQSGLWSRPAKGLGSRLRLGGGGVGGSIVGEPRVGALGHPQWSITHSHRRAISISWEKKRSETMAKPPRTGGERRYFTRFSGGEN